MKRYTLLFLSLLLLLATAAPAVAENSPPGLVINGTEVVTAAGEKGIHIIDGRMYVSAERFAAAIGGTFSTGANGEMSIQTGVDLPSFAGLTEINPKLTLYNPLSPFIPSMGIHHGVQGPHVTVLTSAAGIVNGFELIVPSVVGWQPWFDQPEGQPMELEGLGLVYTQHIYLTDPQGIVPGAADVSLSGRFLGPTADARPYLEDGTFYVPVRAAIESLGGAIGWNGQTWTATAAVTPDRLSWEELVERNPKLSVYEAMSPFVPNMGIHMGVGGPHLTVVQDNAGYVTAMELVQPVDGVPWMPWFDQGEGQIFELEGLGQVWTQHIYLVDPNTIQ